MLNFVYCFDENYNSVALTSINSLLSKVSKKINIYIIHEKPESFNHDLINKEKLSEFKIFQVLLDDVNFPNLFGNHVSRATYYRFYLSKHLPDELEYIIYIDADILCLNNPVEKFENYIELLSKSEENLAARTELLRSDEDSSVNPLLKLEMKNDKYFNAGLMIIDYQYWLKNDIEKKLFKIMHEYYDDIFFWDQDVLNKYFDGKYFEISNKCNYELGGVFNKGEYEEDFIVEEVNFLHYTGKGKPWDANYILYDSSDIFQKYYRMLGLNKYLISHSPSIKSGRRDYFKNILSLKFLKLDNPLSYLNLSIKALFEYRRKIKFMKKRVIYDEHVVTRKKPKNLREKDKYMFSHEYQRLLPPAYIKFLRSPIVINNSIFDIRRGRLHTKDTFYGSHTFTHKLKNTIKNIIRSKKGIKNIENGVWILDTKSENFGHWVIDGLCRYPLVPSDFTSYKILLPERFKIDWITEMLDFLNYPYMFLEKNTKYKVKNLLLTSHAHTSGNYNLEIVNKLRNLFLSDFVKEKNNEAKRVWAYREHLRRSVDNFDDIKKILEKYNFDIIQTDKLSLKEKIELLNNTEIFSGTHGSGLINILFMNKGSKVFEIRNYQNSHQNSVFSLASALDLDYYYMERESPLLEGGKINSKVFEEKLLECIND